MEATSVWISVQPHWTEQFLASVFNRFRTCLKLMQVFGTSFSHCWASHISSPSRACHPPVAAGFVKAAVIGTKGYGFIDFDTHKNAGAALQAMQDAPVPGAQRCWCAAHVS